MPSLAGKALTARPLPGTDAERTSAGSRRARAEAAGREGPPRDYATSAQPVAARLTGAGARGRRDGGLGSG